MSNHGGRRISGGELDFHAVMTDYTGVRLLFERVFALLASRGVYFILLIPFQYFCPHVLFVHVHRDLYYLAWRLTPLVNDEKGGGGLCKIVLERCGCITIVLTDNELEANDSSWCS